MFDPRILLRQSFCLDQLRVETVEEDWAPNTSYDAEVTKVWRQRLGEAALNGHAAWDGTYYRVTNAAAIVANGDVPPTFRLGTIRYRYIATFRPLHEEHKRHGLEALNHLSTVALLRTSDGWYVFGRRSANGAVDLIGGGAQKDELTISSGADLKANIVKEVHEETGIASSELHDLAGLGIVRSSTSNILVVAHANLSLSRQASEAAFTLREEDEMAELVFVPARDLPSFLRGMADYRSLIPELLMD